MSKVWCECEQKKVEPSMCGGCEFYESPRRQNDCPYSEAEIQRSQQMLVRLFGFKDEDEG